MARMKLLSQRQPPLLGAHREFVVPRVPAVSPLQFSLSLMSILSSLAIAVGAVSSFYRSSPEVLDSLSL